VNNKYVLMMLVCQLFVITTSVGISLVCLKSLQLLYVKALFQASNFVV